MGISGLRSILGLLRKTPVHPQWFAFLREDKNLRASCKVLNGLVLDVLEHLPGPDRCLAEIFRVLKPGGTLTIQVPFMYPIHDAPLDFHRWTKFGLRGAANRAGFLVSEEKTIGHPAETAALIANIAISKTVLNWIAARNPLAILALLLPPLILTRNCLAWLIAALSRDEDMMPYSYRMVWTKL